jgi:hypothetical protein
MTILCACVPFISFVNNSSVCLTNRHEDPRGTGNPKDWEHSKLEYLVFHNDPEKGYDIMMSFNPRTISSAWSKANEILFQRVSKRAQNGDSAGKIDRQTVKYVIFCPFNYNVKTAGGVHSLSAIVSMIIIPPISHSYLPSGAVAISPSEDTVGPTKGLKPTRPYNWRTDAIDLKGTAKIEYIQLKNEVKEYTEIWHNN